MALWGLGLLLLAGCKEKPPVASDEERIRGFVTQARRSGDPERFRSLFVEGSAPDDSRRPEYKKYRYQAGHIEMSPEGDTATATVEIHKPGSDELVAEKQWALVKVNGAWRLKDAPLP